ncbi:hypothetical protein HanRHA438_Chr01g0018821 [Helianthus annuus]|nr:hypothetical protein HanRHA438_Chr01g0018821 [Helianthus annuus]
MFICILPNILKIMKPPKKVTVSRKQSSSYRNLQFVSQLFIKYNPCGLISANLDKLRIEELEFIFQSFRSKI